MTERKQPTRLGALLDGLADVVLELDLEGRIHFASLSIEEQLGYPRDTIMDGEAHWDLFHPDDLPTVLELAVRVFDGDAFTHLVSRIRHASGEYLTFESSAQRFDSTGGEGRLAILMRNVSTRRQTESAVEVLPDVLARAQHADSLQILAGGVAHDFGNLLQGILANAEVARAHLDAPDTLDKRLADVTAAAARAAELCRQMLAYTGRGRPQVELIDLHAIIRDLVPLLRASVSKKVVIEPRVPEDSAWLMADATQLRQLLMNLVINAGQAIGDRTGHVTVGSSEDQDTTPPTLIVVVEDDGCGMSAATQAQLFDPFFTTKAGGRGLGLAAVRDVLSAHGGSIDVDSTPDEGSRFMVRLPLQRERARRPTTRETTPRLAAGGRALFVDDEEAIRVVGKSILVDAGFEVTLASDGADAVQRFEAGPAAYDVVVLDMTMPVMDGREALEAIRVLAPSVPIVLSSGYTTHELGPLVDDDPHTTFLAKPYAPRHLIMTLNQLMGGDAP